MRIALAEIGQETDSFSPLVAELSDFEAYGLYFDKEMLERLPGVGPLGGFLDVVAHEPVELVPLVRAWGSAGGMITAATFNTLADALLSRLRSALPIDALFLSLHGAASAEGEDDVEGALLAAAREIVGPRVPIIVPLDHHANVTRRMVESADALIGHETQPHDPPATGRKAARLLLRQLRGEVRITTRWRKIPMITPQDQFLTSAGPMQEWFQRAREWEAEPGVLDVSPYPMQPWLDALEGGWAVVVHTNGAPTLADRVADDMAEEAWRRREAFWRGERLAPQEAVARGLATPGLSIWSDTGDSVYGGAPGDNTTLLAALLEGECDALALVPLVDPAAVERAHQAGVGSTMTLAVGGGFDRCYCRPVEFTGRVAALARGTVVDLADRGVVDLRRTALLRHRGIALVLLDHRSFAINHPILYEHLGVDVSAARGVVLKTASNFQFFSRWQPELLRVDTPGVTQSDLTAFPWQRLPRPIFPLDRVDDWRGPLSPARV